MKILFPILFLFSISFAEMVGDFAPTAVGSKWVYRYSRFFYGMYDSNQEMDTAIISITLLSKNRIATDTVILLDINEQEHFIATIYHKDTTTDSVFSKHYVDTVLISADSIFKKPGYTCRVFPFYKAHLVQRDSLQKGLVGMDSMFFFPKPPPLSYPGPTYLRYVGLYLSIDVIGCSGMGGCTNSVTSLVSYNNREFILDGIKGDINQKTKNLQYQSKYQRVFISAQNTRLTAPVYSLNGKRINENQMVPMGILIKPVLQNKE